MPQPSPQPSHEPGDTSAPPPRQGDGGAGAGPAPVEAAAREAELLGWVAQVCGGRVVRATQTSGGNRCLSWAIEVEGAAPDRSHVFLRYAPPRPPGVEPYTVKREAQVYRAIAGSDVKAPRLIVEHPQLEAVLTDRVEGIAEFRRLKDDAQKQAIAREFMHSLAALHRIKAEAIVLDGGGRGTRIADHVGAELTIWRAMYEETGRGDPLLELAFAWLAANMPDPNERVVLVHGDAGPGNFLFQDGHLTGLIDWELAHLGDPMEDIAWFSMRCVMEPVPDFAASLRDYAQFAGRPIDAARVLYHRVFVSTRVVVIRHRNVTGEPAHAIVSAALNRRLLVEALAEASGTEVPRPAPVEAPETARAGLFDHVLDDLREVVVARSRDGQVIAKAKNAAKVIKYLKEVDRFGAAMEAAEAAALAAILGRAPASIEAGQGALAAALRGGSIALAPALAYFAGQAARQAQLAAGSSGSIARRHYPKLCLTEAGDPR